MQCFFKGVQFWVIPKSCGTQVLVEGANAALLDIDFGTYPFVAFLI